MKKHQNNPKDRLTAAEGARVEQEYQEFLSYVREEHTERFDNYMEEVAAFAAQAK